MSRIRLAFVVLFGERWGGGGNGGSVQYDFFRFGGYCWTMVRADRFEAFGKEVKGK